MRSMWSSGEDLGSKKGTVCEELPACQFKTQLDSNRCWYLMTVIVLGENLIAGECHSLCASRVSLTFFSLITTRWLINDKSIPPLLFVTRKNRCCLCNDCLSFLSIHSPWLVIPLILTNVSLIDYECVHMWDVGSHACLHIHTQHFCNFKVPE